MFRVNNWTSPLILAALLGCSFQKSASLLAQQPVSPPPSAAAQNPSSPTPPARDPLAAGAVAQKDDRIFWTLPNYLTVENASALPPLTPGAKIKLIARDTFDPVSFGFIAIEAGINQATNTNPTFRQGLIGYSKRYGLAFADNAIGNFLTSGVVPVVLHQDPRFYQMGHGGFPRRFLYAGSRIFVTRSDAGKTEFNSAELLGNIFAAGISNAYHPGPRTLQSNCDIFATQMVWDAISFEMKEFWPDLHHLVSHH